MVLRIVAYQGKICTLHSHLPYRRRKSRSDDETVCVSIHGAFDLHMDSFFCRELRYCRQQLSIAEYYSHLSPTCDNHSSKQNMVGGTSSCLMDESYHIRGTSRSCFLPLLRSDSSVGLYLRCCPVHQIFVPYWKCGACSDAHTCDCIEDLLTVLSSPERHKGVVA